MLKCGTKVNNKIMNHKEAAMKMNSCSFSLQLLCGHKQKYFDEKSCLLC